MFLDDNEASNLQFDSELREVAINPKQPLNHLMVISMLEHICSVYAKDEEASEALFKGLYIIYNPLLLYFLP